MDYKDFKKILHSIYLKEELILEEIHKELHDVISSSPITAKNKHKEIASKIKEITDRGEQTGVEGSMPKGSSRLYLKHDKPIDVKIDGKKAKLQTGTKVAIRSNLDRHHDHKFFGGSLGQIQMEAENGEFSNSRGNRVLEKVGENEFKTNKHGIFPPLIDHDELGNSWSHVGHVRDVSQKEFRELTKTKSHPQGITHKDFYVTLIREHNKSEGKHWQGSPEREKHFDKVIEHPLVERFNVYHSNTGEPPHDYMEIKNLGVFEHPNGTKQIVSRDHGFNENVRSAYLRSRRKKAFG